MSEYHCPFCGASDIRAAQHGGPDTFVAVCNQCGAVGPAKTARDCGEAVMRAFSFPYDERMVRDSEIARRHGEVERQKLKTEHEFNRANILERQVIEREAEIARLQHELERSSDIDVDKCETCDGRGRVYAGYAWRFRPCPDCGGTGKRGDRA